MIVLKNMDDLMDTDLRGHHIGVCMCVLAIHEGSNIILETGKLLTHKRNILPTHLFQATINCAYSTLKSPYSPPPSGHDGTPRPYSQLNSGTVLLHLPTNCFPAFRISLPHTQRSPNGPFRIRICSRSISKEGGIPSPGSTTLYARIETSTLLCGLRAPSIVYITSTLISRGSPGQRQVDRTQDLILWIGGGGTASMRWARS